ncbi:MAG: MerR family transcriptional regulator [Chloroflexi bacterium]|nr:MerR family transcriptional regulator [Chloroflexota bacterium]MCC6897216.1 MerR family transcriptional regulator [Anaerolineae bacterium]
MYTVKQLSELAGVSVRTLHYYDEIGLLTPSQVGANSYRYYDEAAVLRLQQILFYREMGLELTQIKDVLDSPNFDLVMALKSHRAALQDKSERLQKLVETVDNTIKHLMEGTTMSKRQLFEAFSDETQKDYEREARLQYGPDNVNASIKRWNSYTQAQREAIGHEGNAVYNDLVDAIEAGKSPLDAEVQAILERWHNHLRYFYEPNLDILRNLGETYVSSPDFRKNFDKIDPRLAEYMREGITQYVDELETAEIERMLADDAARKGEG